MSERQFSDNLFSDKCMQKIMVPTYQDYSIHIIKYLKKKLSRCFRQVKIQVARDRSTSLLMSLFSQSCVMSSRWLSKSMRLWYAFPSRRSVVTLRVSSPPSSNLLKKKQSEEQRLNI